MVEGQALLRRSSETGPEKAVYSCGRLGEAASRERQCSELAEGPPWVRKRSEGGGFRSDTPAAGIAEAPLAR